MTHILKYSAIAFILSSSASVAATNCDIAQLAHVPDKASVIEHADNVCMQTWFHPDKASINSVFSEEQMVLIANALNTKIAAYQGDEASATEIYYLSEYVRAAYYVNYYNSTVIAPYSHALNLRFTTAINRFLQSPYALTASQHNMNALGSLTSLVDSVRVLPENLPTLMTLLSTLNKDNAENSTYVEALNNIFRALNGSSSDKGVQDYLSHHLEVLDQLHQFIISNDWALKTHAAVVVSNAARELSRLLKIQDPAIKNKILTIQEDLLARYPLGGENDSIWVGIAEMVGYYAPDKQQQLGLSDAKLRLEQHILPMTFRCEGPATVRAQKMTQEQAIEVCAALNQKEQDFHSLITSASNPVNDDLNDHVEVIVFDSSYDYTVYSNFLFGNTTNNGGQYLEGNPSDLHNIARFVAYRNTSADGYSVWNLEHEYVHYLDGRYNQYGDFNYNLQHGFVVWWLEGFAEYMHYGNSYTDAIALGQERTYSLSEVLATTYSHDTNRIYRWGYLAVRFLFDNAPDQVEQLLQLSRQGHYTQWAALVQKLGLQYNEEFATWLTTLKAPTTPTTPSHSNKSVITLTAETPVELSGAKYSEQLFAITVPKHVTEFSVSLSGGDYGDAELYASFNQVAHYYNYQITDARSGNNERIRFATDEQGFVKPGVYYFSVAGRSAYEHVVLNTEMKTAESTQTAYQADDLSPITLQADTHTNITVNKERYMVYFVPKGHHNVRVWVTPKDQKQDNQGNVDLYFGKKTWPVLEQYDLVSQRSDSYEYLETKVDGGHFVFLMLNAKNPHNTMDVYVTSN
ncbi:M9 family metallopeptidase [Photobacterium damselae]|uniref:M9 family metallopeptidase n=1 Tax=Photobacterium damselae TaxID=38293 RepID=UPI002543E68A